MVIERKPNLEGTPERAVVIGGKYRLLSVLGRGGMGTVWRAEHLELGAPVAVKLIDPRAPSGPEALRQCQKEARAAAALRSPHVVQVLDFGMDDATGSPYIVMELLEGESLADRLARLGKISPAETVRLVTHVARALGRAHEAGIVHRDLKPANVFLVRNEDEEIAKVLDFGTARVHRAGALAESTATTGAPIGTPYYMSPEHISGQVVDHRTDLWALAVMAFECLVGHRPFDAREIGQLVLQICTYPLPVPSQIGAVPAGLDAWFQQAAAREADRRFQSARELADELRRVCGGAAAGASGPRAEQASPRTLELEPLDPPEPSATPPGARAHRSRAARWVAGGAALVALAVVAGGLVLRRSVRPAPTAGSAPTPAAAATSPSPPVVGPERPPAPTAERRDRRAPEPSAAPPADAPSRAPDRSRTTKPAHRAVRSRARVARRPAEPPPSPTPAPPMESVLDHRR